MMMPPHMRSIHLEAAEMRGCTSRCWNISIGTGCRDERKGHACSYAISQTGAMTQRGLSRDYPDNGSSIKAINDSIAVERLSKASVEIMHRHFKKLTRAKSIESAEQGNRGPYPLLVASISGV